jgi:hypothetical protein
VESARGSRGFKIPQIPLSLSLSLSAKQTAATSCAVDLAPKKKNLTKPKVDGLATNRRRKVTKKKRSLDELQEQAI